MAPTRAAFTAEQFDQLRSVRLKRAETALEVQRISAALKARVEAVDAEFQATFRGLAEAHGLNTALEYGWNDDTREVFVIDRS